MTLQCFSSKHRDIELQATRKGRFLQRKMREFSGKKWGSKLTYRPQKAGNSARAKSHRLPECSKNLAQDHTTHSILGWSLKPTVMFFSFKMFIIHQSQFSDETYLDAHTFTVFSLQKGYPIPSTVWSSLINGHPIKIAIWGVYPLVW